MTLLPFREIVTNLPNVILSFLNPLQENKRHFFGIEWLDIVFFLMFFPRSGVCVPVYHNRRWILGQRFIS